MDHLIKALKQYMGVWHLSLLGVIHKTPNTWHWSGVVHDDGNFQVRPPFKISSDPELTNWIDGALQNPLSIQLSNDKCQLLYRSVMEDNCWLWFQAEHPFQNADQWIQQHSASVNLLASSLLELGSESVQNHFVQSILDNSPNLISIRDRSGNLLLVNQSFQNWVKKGFQVVGKSLFQIFPHDVAERLHAQDLKVFNTGEAFEYDETLKDSQGRDRTFLTLKFPVTQNLHQSAVCTIATDISDRINYEHKLQESESSLRIIIENLPTAIVILDTNSGKFEEVNRGSEVLFGLSRLQLCKMGPGDVSPEYQENGKTSMEEAQNQIFKAMNGETPVFEWTHQHISGRQTPCEVRLVRLPKSEGARVMGIITDISERKAAEQALRNEQSRLNYLAHHDTLTQLPNRLLLLDRLNQATLRSKREKMQIAVFMLDLDGFKEINDSLGHNVGDLVLKEVADRIQKLLRASDTAARLGGDEFVVLIENLQGEDEAVVVAKKLLQTLSQPMHLDGNEIQISASIGISLFPAVNSKADYLLDYADMAMYQAKKTGKNRFYLYDQK